VGAILSTGKRAADLLEELAIEALAARARRDRIETVRNFPWINLYPLDGTSLYYVGYRYK
jgi:hypothetical protein